MAIAIANSSLVASGLHYCPLCTSQVSSDACQKLPCCQAVVCYECTEAYIRVRIESGEHSVPCPSTDCRQELAAEVINQFTSESQQRLLELLKLNAANSSTMRSCPNCSHIKSVSPDSYRQMKKAHCSAKESARLNQIICEGCEKPWCYYCYGPAHPGTSCKKNSDGSSLFNKWTMNWDEENHQQNAFMCPGCGIPTQRDGGCPNMNCNNCFCYWCYHCGKKTYGSSILLGSHGGGVWDVNICERVTIFGSKKTSRRLRWFKLVQEIFVIGVLGIAVVIVFLPLLPLVVLLAPPIIILIFSARELF